MSIKFKRLKEMTEDELIEIHDKNSGNINGTSNRETPEMVRNELFRKELGKIVKELEKGNKTTTTLTRWITGMTLLILIFTIVLVFVELNVI